MATSKGKPATAQPSKEVDTRQAWAAVLKKATKIDTEVYQKSQEARAVALQLQQKCARPDSAIVAGVYSKDLSQKAVSFRKPTTTTSRSLLSSSTRTSRQSRP